MMSGLAREHHYEATVLRWKVMRGVGSYNLGKSLGCFELDRDELDGYRQICPKTYAHVHAPLDVTLEPSQMP